MAKSTPQLRVSIAQDVIRASVSAPRMYAWFGLNLLLTVAGLILMWLQSRCYGKTVRDFTLAAILMDPQEILRQDESGICSAVAISTQDKSLGALKLVEEPADTPRWHHHRLVLDRRSTAADDTGLRERRSLFPKRAKQLSEPTESQTTLAQTSSYSVQDLYPLLNVDR